MTNELAQQLAAARAAQTPLQQWSAEQVNGLLNQIADAIVSGADDVLSANQADLAQLEPADPLYDRIQLTTDRIHDLAEGLRTVAALPDPVGRLLDERTRPNGLRLQKVSVPFGVVASIYEARPNVTVDIVGLCLKSRNVAVLKGGREAQQTSEALMAIVHTVLVAHGLPATVATLLPADRSIAAELLTARDFVDLLVPRGSQGLIDWVREHARVPIIETGAGVCHTFVDKTSNITMARDIITNAKTRRPSVCNSLDTLIVHAELLDELPSLIAPLADHQVKLRADQQSYQALEGHYPVELLKHATGDDFGTEFLSLRMAIKTVSSFDEALNHIAQYGSKHSEAIVTEDQISAETFLTLVDAAVVYHNASTAFTDGGEFGMGAELGISTQKLHARGPMALPELTTYKWLVRGAGQTR